MVKGNQYSEDSEAGREARAKRTDYTLKNRLKEDLIMTGSG